jgi:hypothetical protein
MATTLVTYTAKTDPAFQDMGTQLRRVPITPEFPPAPGAAHTPANT